MTKTSTIGLVSLALSALGLYAWLRPEVAPVGSPEDARADAGGSAHDDHDLTLKQDVAQLTRELRLLKAQLEAERASTAQPAPEPDELEEETASPPSVTMEETWQARADAVAQTFEQEPVDRRWSAQKEDFVREAIRNDVLLRDRLLSLECHSTTCRVEIADDGSSDFQKALPLLIHQLGAQLPTVQTRPPDPDAETPSLVLYMQG